MPIQRLDPSARHSLIQPHTVDATCARVSSFGRTSNCLGRFRGEDSRCRGRARATELRSKMIRNTFSWKGLHRWRAALIVVFVIPAVLGASAVTPSVEKLQNPLVE